MFDINFFKDCQRLKKKIISRNIFVDKTEIYKAFESFRSRKPFVFNIETTNACNMSCVMCPRPNLMQRPVRHMDMALFEKILAQITPYKDSELEGFWKFIKDEYSVHPEQRNENAFYFYTVSNSLVLHGYGEPPLDPFMPERVALCSKYDIPTYFSCVAANIDVGKTVKMMKAGLGVIKFAIDSLDDKTQKEIRGEKNDFTNSYRKMCDLVKIKSEDPRIKTKIVITMLELSTSQDAVRMHEDFMDLWRDKPVYAYIKSQDNRWYYEGDSSLECRSHYESQYCEYPWTSLTVMVDGSVVPCTQDYNNEMVLGDANKEPLAEIWNSAAYDDFRKWHIYGDFPKGHRCVSKCDQRLVCDRLKEKEDEKTIQCKE